MLADSEAPHLRTATTHAVLEYVDLRSGWRDLQAETTKAIVPEQPILGLRLGGVDAGFGDTCCWHVIANLSIAITTPLDSVISDGLG